MNEEKTEDSQSLYNGDKTWYTMEKDEVFSVLDADEQQGLSKDDVKRRLEEYGPNKLPSKEKPGALKRFLRQFNNMLIYVLIAAAVFTAFLFEWLDTAVILAVVIINAIIGFIQEGKAEKAMESIRDMLSPTANVLRDGKEREISAEELVPGDIVMLSSGDRVPADLRIFKVRNAQVDEAVLTGESVPVDKQVDILEKETPLGDRKNMAYSGTILTGGQLQGVVVATGGKAEIGRISEMVSQVEELSTPLLRKIDVFGRWLSVVIVLMSAVFFVLGYYFRDFTAVEMFMAVVSLAVASIPEGLPAIMTITLALGVKRMAKRNAIIRRLPAVETLGSVTVICSDKTGTLTRNEMTVAKVIMAQKNFSVSGVGYKPEGEFSIDKDNGNGDNGNKVSPEEYPPLVDLARAGLLVGEARLIREDDQWTIQGMPTEGSLVVLAAKAGITPEEIKEKHPRLDVIPFESERRYMAGLYEDSEDENIACIKGAPEKVLDMCSKQRTDDQDEPMDKDTWMQQAEALADNGHRVLAIALKKMGSADSLDDDDIGDLTLLGLVGIIDPPRQEAIEAIKECRKAGIQVKMITGDHVLTARSIGASMGIGDGEHAISGNEMENAEDEELVRLVEENEVFARSSPEHKLRIMEALQSQNQVVAMTGDGVNDAPALKRANVGIAMGIKGSEATKEAAEMVLADDNFATIQVAIKEGRTIYDNLIKTILFILPTNGAEALMVISSVLIIFDVMPITPLQILWVNMVTAVTLALALSFEPAEDNIMDRWPRPPDEPIISRYLIWRIAFVSVIIAAASILLFHLQWSTGASIEQARTVAVNTLVAGQLFYLFNSRFLDRSSLSIRRLISNRKALVAVAVLVFLQLGFTYLSPLQNLFGTASIHVMDWKWIIVSGMAVFLLVEMEKALVRFLRPKSSRKKTVKEAKTPEEVELPDQPAYYKSHPKIFARETAQAIEELRRPAAGLFISGLMAGSCIALSVLLIGVFLTLTGDNVHQLVRPALMANAYAAGFIVVILARMDLFTHYSTITIFPVLTHQARLRSMARLWVIVYIANLLGGAAFAVLPASIGPLLEIIRPEVFVDIAIELVEHPWYVILGSAFLTGWLMGLLAWLLIEAREIISKVFFIWLIAGVIGFAHLHHSIVGALEIMLGMIGSDAVFISHLGYFLLWTTMGNIGGGLFFAVLIRFSVLLHRKEYADNFRDEK
jgi:magnesium-transporting ATPase (P-type)/formate/nitrite transporter FocA (FNT family)